MNGLEISHLDAVATRSKCSDASFVLVGGFMYSADAQNHYQPNAWVAVQNGVIKAMGKGKPGDNYAHLKHIDVTGKMLLPGLVNPHWHESLMAPNPEQADDSHLRLEPYANGGDIEALGSMFGFISNIGKQLEYPEALAVARWSLWTQLRSGTTALGDIGSVNLPNALAQAALDLGMRIRVSRWGSDIMIPNQGSECVRVADTQEQTDDWHAIMQTWHQHPSGLVDGMPSVVGAFGSSDQQLQALADIASQYNTPIAAHLCPLRNEAAANRRVFGRSAIERFDDFGLLNKRLLAVHTAYASEEEFERIVERQVNLCYSPAHYGMSGESTLSESGQVARFIRAGAPVSCSSDGDISYIGGMPEAMRSMHLSMNEAANDNTTCPPTLALRMGSYFGAKALGWQDKIGSIEVGKAADFTIVDINDWRYATSQHPLRQFLIAGSSRDVSDVFVNGKALVRNGQPVHVDEATLLNDFKQALNSIRKRLAA